MPQQSLRFSQSCPCGGRTGYANTARNTIHEASKKHQRWLSQGQTTSPTTQTTLTPAGPSTYSSQSVFLMEGEA